jgi:nicotinate dehydrogenase subunit A
MQLVVNGIPCTVGSATGARLLDVLRDELGLKGTREGCGAGDCGACTVLLAGRPVASCITPLAAAEGAPVITVEGLDARLRQAFVAEQAAQCGYCSSGMLVATAALLRLHPRPDEAAAKQALEGHLCRCGAHNRIVRAVLRAAAG